MNPSKSMIVTCALLAASPALAARSHRPAARACCEAPAGTPVEVELTAPVSSKDQKTGAQFALRLAAPLILDGRVALRAGTPGVGEVIEATRPGMGGKGAKLVLAAKYLQVHGRQIPLDGLHLSRAGKGNVMTAQAIGLTGIAFAPLGFVGFAVKGGDVTFPAGTKAAAKISDDTVLASLGRPSRAQLAAAARFSQSDPAEGAQGVIAIGAPPPGQGQVVFFRGKSLLGTGQWFNVREDGKALGKLENGAYFVQVTSPGPHTYTAKTEPEFNDSLKLQVDAGETYFVEGVLTKGVVIGAADLEPSDRIAFDKASKTLKLAPRIADTTETPAEPVSAVPAPAAEAATAVPPSAPADVAPATAN
jgi:hypothetical protein